MPEPRPSDKDFLEQLTSLVEEHLSNEQFGVSELAEAVNMSRSNLLRKVNKLTKLSVSQFIRQIRLQRSMELLRKSAKNVSEVSFEVGFSSTSYFIKCFREYYGYPPGEVGRRMEAGIPPESEPAPQPVKRRTGRRLMGWGGVALAFILGLGGWIYFSADTAKSAPTLEKSIAVLPFRNDSSDSTNLYLINGLMESTLTNLQKIKGLRVVSRTSTEKYRNTTLTIPEMAEELNVSYFVEGSGQKIGDRILLNIQLIEASTDSHLWAKQYRRETKDIFELQQEIARNIADEIQVIITPEEKKIIEKRPTENLAAYDQYLKGRDLFYNGERDNLEAALPFFKKAIELDGNFALAYADATMVFFYLDIYQQDRQFGEEIRTYAEKAYLLDPQLSESLVAKALSYIYNQDYQTAVPYLEKALAINPNSGLVLHFLSEFYYAHVPNTAKYLEYALMKTRVDVATTDSTTACYNYLQLSNALLQAGFIDESLTCIRKSLNYDPSNRISGFVKIYIYFVKTRDLVQTRTMMEKEMQKDTADIMLLQELGKLSYLMRDYKTAYRYYTRFIDLSQKQNLDIYRYENLKIGMVFEKMGHPEKAKTYIGDFKDYAENDHSIYNQINQAIYYAYLGDTDKALDHLRQFSKEDNYYYWILLLPMDPVVDAIRDLPEYKEIMQSIETKFWNNNKAIRADLESKGLLPLDS
ncbi:MAG TPA: helix-turn-helix domain-containing protein [Flavilitoribacter sp.]|nr:helix-turn-helix domain-containing protein [Flavilitoribacter sp.]HMQ88740.1 helix-turn-helix domain-containing protein [Flavilitoribacter sp.]